MTCMAEGILLACFAFICRTEIQQNMDPVIQSETQKVPPAVII